MRFESRRSDRKVSHGRKADRRNDAKVPEVELAEVMHLKMKTLKMGFAQGNAKVQEAVLADNIVQMPKASHAHSHEKLMSADGKRYRPSRDMLLRCCIRTMGGHSSGHSIVQQENAAVDWNHSSNPESL